MIQWPQKLGGTHPLVGWLNRLLEKCTASEIKQVVGGRLVENGDNDGKALVVYDQRGGAASSRIQRFKITDVSNVSSDYVTAVVWDGTNEGSEEDIALPPELQTVPADTPEIYPPYAVDEIIYAAIPTGGTGVTDVIWLDLNVDARRWARNIELCNSTYALFHCSDIRPL